MTDTLFPHFESVYVTRYMGSKYRLLDLIIPAIISVSRPNSPVIDLMAGTHAVGYALRIDRTIIANDVQAYSETFGTALLLNDRIPHVKNRYMDDFGKLETRAGTKGWFSETYVDTYFSYDQCREIEEIRARIAQLTDVVLMAIYLTALAFAMGLCQSSPGHFAQFLPADHSRVRVLREKSIFEAFVSRCQELEFRIAGPRCHLFRQEAGEFLNLAAIDKLAREGSVVYLDPPYTEAQYSRYYHLLETVILNDHPTVLHKAKYRNDRFQSSFCSATKAPAAFKDLVEKIASRGWGLVLSYSSHGIIPIGDLTELTKNYYPAVSIESRKYSHSMQGRGQVSDRLEYVIKAATAK